MLCGGRAPLQLEGPGAVPGEVERRRAPGDDAEALRRRRCCLPALAQERVARRVEPRHRHTRIAAQTGRDLVGVAQDGHVPVGLGHVGRGAALSYAQGVLVAGRPQDVAQRHAQDALVAPSHRFRVFLGFVLFRFFDIAKPWPVSWLEKRLSGAFGIMIDDMAAGLIAGILLFFIQIYG